MDPTPVIHRPRLSTIPNGNSNKRDNQPTLLDNGRDQTEFPRLNKVI